MDEMNTLCNNSRHLTYLVESFCNNFRISELMGFIFRSRLYCLSKVRFAEIEIRPAEAESANSWSRLYWYKNFHFLDSYFMHLASESWIRKQEFALPEFPALQQTSYRDFWIVDRIALKYEEKAIKSRRQNTFCLLFRELSVYLLLKQEARNDSRENCLDIKFLLSGLWFPY